MVLFYARYSGSGKFSVPHLSTSVNGIDIKFQQIVSLYDFIAKTHKTQNPKSWKFCLDDVIFMQKIFFIKNKLFFILSYFSNKTIFKGKAIFDPYNFYQKKSKKLHLYIMKCVIFKPLLNISRSGTLGSTFKDSSICFSQQQQQQ